MNRKKLSRPDKRPLIPGQHARRAQFCPQPRPGLKPLSDGQGRGAVRSHPGSLLSFYRQNLGRCGGVSLGSSIHKAEVAWDEDSWRADIFALSFGAIEVYSRFALNGRAACSQYNYLRFLRPEDAQWLKIPQKAEKPSNWPRFVFPASSYNGVLFRGIEPGQLVEFEIDSGDNRPEMVVVLEGGGEGDRFRFLTMYPANFLFTERRRRTD